MTCIRTEEGVKFVGEEGKFIHETEGWPWEKILQQIMGHWGSTTWTQVKYFREMKFL